MQTQSCCYLSYRKDLCLAKHHGRKVKQNQQTSKKKPNKTRWWTKKTWKLKKRCSHFAASCWADCVQAAVLSSAGRGRHWAAAERKHHEAGVCTSEADRPVKPTPVLLEPTETYGEKTERKLVLRRFSWNTTTSVTRTSSGCPDLSQELALLLSHPRLIPDCQLQHSFSEVPPMDWRVHEGLVPPRLHWLLYCLRPPLTLVTERRDVNS